MRFFLDSLSDAAPFDAATCFPVSQFLVDRAERVRFFAGIAGRLRAGGLLTSSDQAADVASPQYEVLPAWMRMMSAGDVSAEAIERIRVAYTRDVAVLPPGVVADIIASGGFEAPTPRRTSGT